MAASYSNVTQSGLFSQQYPPALLPKPGKDNARLQKLLKKTAKKKAAPQTTQTPAPFRSSLSPVNEASADLERSEHCTPPKTPESPLFSSQPPRFNVRPLYQHVASPYPQHRGIPHGRASLFSPQPFSAPANVHPPYFYTAPIQHPQHVYSPPAQPAGALVVPGGGALVVPESVTQTVTTLTPESTSSVSKITMPAAEMRTAAPIPVVETVSHTILKTTTVITPLIKSRSPRPTFKASLSRSPKPMFDVPQIQMYTANTYEVIKSPLHDSTGLSAIGGTTTQRRTPTSEIRRGLTPTSEVKRVLTPSSEVKRVLTPSSETKRVLTPTSEVKRVLTPTSEVNRVLTPTSEVNRVLTPTSEVKRVLTPSSEVNRVLTPTSEVNRVLTPTSEVKRSVTPTSDVKRVLTPSSEILRPKTPTYDSSPSRTFSGRPKTPSYHVTRSKTPVFEISRPNPLLFAVSPITTETQRSKPPTPVSPTTEMQRSKPPTPVSPTTEMQRSKPPTPVSPTTEMQRSKPPTPVSPTTEMQRSKPPTPVSPTTEMQRSKPPTPVSPTTEMQRSKPPTPVSPTTEMQRSKPPTPVSPTTETQISKPPTPVSPTTEMQRSKPPTPVSPTTEMQRSKPPTPVSPTTEMQRSKPPTPVSPTTETEQSKELVNAKSAATPNGVISLHENVSKPDAPRPEAIDIVKSARPKSPTAPLGYQRPKTPTNVSPKPTLTSIGYQRPRTPSYESPVAPTYGYQRPKTPSYEGPKPPSPATQMSKTPSYEPARPAVQSLRNQRPKTPISGTSPQVSPLAFQRPKTPTYVSPQPRSTYYGLTPAEYAAHGGIKTHTPSFGLSGSKTPTQEESQSTAHASEDSDSTQLDTSGKTQPLAGETHKENGTILKQEVTSPPVMIVPTIVVSQASDIPTVSSHEPLPAETPRVQAVSEIKTPAKETEVSTGLDAPETPVTDVKPSALPPENTSDSKKTPPAKDATQTVEKVMVESISTTSTTIEKDSSKAVTEGAEPIKKMDTDQDKVESEPIKKMDTDQDKVESEPIKKIDADQEKVESEPIKKMDTDQDKVESEPIKKMDTDQDKVESEPIKKIDTDQDKVESEPIKKMDTDQDEVKPDPAPVPSATPSSISETKDSSNDLPAAEPLLKVIQKPKGIKSKVSGWSRLKKHLVVEVEEPKFPEMESKSEAKKEDEPKISETGENDQTAVKARSGSEDGDKSEPPKPKTLQMWDAVLFQMFSTKENIMQQIEASRREEDNEDSSDVIEVPSFAHRLPVLLFSPRFDAKRLREAASRPLTKISTVFEMGLIGRKNKDEEPKDFNRTARGFAAS